MPPKVESHTTTQSSHLEPVNAHYRALMSLTPLLIGSQTASPIAPNLNSSIPKVRFGAKLIQVGARGFIFGVCG